MVETARQGASANRDEIERLVRPWASMCATSNWIRFSSGTAIRIASCRSEPARVLARNMDRSRSVFFADEGHFSVLVNRAKDLLEALKPD